MTRSTNGIKAKARHMCLRTNGTAELATWNCITQLEQLEQYLELTPDERAGCLFASNKLALAITPYFFNLIDPSDPDDLYPPASRTACRRKPSLRKNFSIRSVKKVPSRWTASCTAIRTVCCF